MNVVQRDVLLVPFPFSDFSGKKVRPVLVVSNDKFNYSSDDVIICGITRNIDKNQYVVKIDTKNLEEGKLFNPCCVRVENILKMDKKLLLKKIGKMPRGAPHPGRLTQQTPTKTKFAGFAI